MATWCLTKEAEIKLLEELRKDGDPKKMRDRSPNERHLWFVERFGELNGTQLNALFESKLLLPNQQKAMQAFIKQSGGSKQVKRDMMTKVQKLNKALDKAGIKEFFKDLAKKRLGVEVTEEELKKMTELSKKISDLESKTNKTKSDVPLGRAKLDLMDYTNSLNGKKANLLTNIAGVPRSVLASLDLSAPLNQGWGMVSRKQFYTSLGTMLKSAVSKDAFRDLQAEIITHPKYDLAKKAGLRLTDLGDKLEMREEQFMTTLLDKVPGIAASQRAYTAFLNKIRLDFFNDVVNKAEISGEDISVGSQTTKDLASMVNDFTGGARVGKIEGAVPMLNATFFSPRKIASTINMLNPVNYVNPKLSKTARLERTRNIIGSISLTLGVIALYSLLTGKKQEADPTSSDFGKIRSGDTRLDVSGGNATYLTLISRIVKNIMKGSASMSNSAKLIGKFLRYKLSPNASLLIDAITGENAIGEKKTVLQSVIDRFKPMFAQSLVELLKSDTDGKFGFALGGLFGGGLNTYSIKTDWDNSTSQELKIFKQKVGSSKFQEANDTFNARYDIWLKQTSSTSGYAKLSEDSKQTLNQAAKDKLKTRILQDYGFKYKAPKETRQQKQEKKNIKKLLP